MQTVFIKGLHVTILKSQKPSSCNTVPPGKQLDLIRFHTCMDIAFNIMSAVNEILLREQLSFSNKTFFNVNFQSQKNKMVVKRETMSSVFGSWQ